MEPNEADRKTALEWYAKWYQNANEFADTDGPGSAWGSIRKFSIDGFIAGMRAERERREKIMRLVQQLADAIRNGEKHGTE